MRKPKLSKSAKDAMKEALLVAAEEGIRDMLRTSDGEELFGSGVEVLPYTKLIEIRSPGPHGPTYFEVIVKERF